MIVNFIQKNISKKSNFYFLSGFLFLVFLITIAEDFINFDNSANLSALLINYEGGFIRRGLLGQISIFLFERLSINPIIFFIYLFAIMHLLQLTLFLLLIKKYTKNIFILYFLALSPALVLFYIYDSFVYFDKQIFFNVGILLHAFYASQILSSKLRNYILFLAFVIIPIISINILIHEAQFFFIFFHILISYVVLTYQNKKFKFSTEFYLYFLLLLPIIVVSVESLRLTSDAELFNIEKKVSGMKFFLLNNLNFIYETYPDEKNFRQFDELAGNLNLKIGSIMKIYQGNYFYYHNALTLFIAFILAVLFFFVYFHYTLLAQEIIIKKSILSSYLYFFLPGLLVFFFVSDFGRSMNMFTTHMLAFYLIFNLKEKRKILEIGRGKKFLLNTLKTTFLVFYVFFWILPHAVGWDPIVKPTKPAYSKYSNLHNETKKIFFYSYYLIDKNIITLPRADFMKLD